MLNMMTPQYALIIESWWAIGSGIDGKNRIYLLSTDLVLGICY